MMTGSTPPRVSVVLPVFNGSHTLAASITSILQQTLFELELIIVNDGSSDDSLSIAQAFAAQDRRIYVETQTNQGLIATLNRACSLARAPLIARMDADDISALDRLAAQVDFLDAQPRVGLVGSFYREIDSDGAVIGQKDMPVGGVVVRHHLQELGNAFVHSSVMFRRTAWEKCGPYRGAFLHAEDYDLWLRMAEHFEVNNIPRYLIDYRRHPNSVSNKNIEQQQFSAMGARHCSRVRRRGAKDPSEGVKKIGFPELESWGLRGEDLCRQMQEWLVAQRELAASWGAPTEQHALLDSLESSYRHRLASVLQGIRAPINRSRIQFSVGIPVYNHEAFLTSAVRSALLSPRVTEVLVVDDGSTDKSREIISSLQSQFPDRVRDLTVPGQGNVGAHARLNQLVQTSSNRHVAILNSDDLFVADRFERLASCIEQHDPGLIFGNLLIMSDNSRLLKGKRGPFLSGRPFPEGLDINRAIETNDLLPLLADQNFAGTTSNFLLTRECFNAVGGFRNFRYVHDWDFLLRACLLSSVRYLPHYLTAYRFHGSNTIIESSAKVNLEIREMAKAILDEFSGKLDQRGVAATLRAVAKDAYYPVAA